MLHWDPPAVAYAIPREFWSSHDRLYLAGRECPGRAKLTGTKTHKLDKKDALGQDGATTTHTGYEPAEIDILLVLWTQDDLDSWARMVPALQPKTSKRTPQPTGKLLAGIPGGLTGEDQFVFNGSGALLLGSSSSAPPRDGPNPVDINHPALRIMGIKSIYIASIGVMKEGAAKGSMEVAIRCQENRPAGGQNVLRTISASASDITQVAQTNFGEPAVPVPPSQTAAGP